MKKMLWLAMAVTILAIPAMAAAPAEYRAEYEGNGRVEIDFRNDVDYKNVSVTAADPSGAAQTVTILETDDDDLTFRIDNIQDDTTYSYTVSGVREGRSGDFGSFSGTFTTPKAGEVVISEIDGDVSDGEVEVEFLGRVDFENPTVSVVRADGTALEADIEELDGDGMEIRVRGLERGEEYTVTINGVSQRGAGTFGSVSRGFVAR